MQYKKVFDGCYHGFVKGNPNPVVELEKNTFGRKLWTVSVRGVGRIVEGSFDCFTLPLAMKLGRKCFKK